MNRFDYQQQRRRSTLRKDINIEEKFIFMQLTKVLPVTGATHTADETIQLRCSNQTHKPSLDLLKTLRGHNQHS